jgi:hypothetical protein
LAVWATLPLSAGPAASDALEGWSTGPQVVGAVLLWSAWAVGLLAVVAPRPVGLTAIRTIAPLLALLAVVALVTGEVDDAAGVGAVVATVIAAACVARAPLALAAANAAAYGDEARYPLRTPPALYLGPLPLARIATGAAVTAAPLLLANGQIVWGVVAGVLGAPVVVVLARALHGLSRRWFVLVPAGVVVADPLTLADPVLFPREYVVALRPVPAGVVASPGTLDLRLGATAGGVAVRLTTEAELFRARRARRGSTSTRTTELLVGTVRRDQLLTSAATRRIRVEVPGRARATQAATPPPTSSSPA